MACLTCKRRKKQCDDRRPRCSTCKTSHLRCTYDGPPTVLRFHHEFAETEAGVSSGGGNCREQQGSSSEPLARLIVADLSDTVRENNTTSLSTQEPLDESVFAEFLALWDDDFSGFMEMDGVALPDSQLNLRLPDTQASTELESNGSSFTLKNGGVDSSSSTSVSLEGVDNSQPPAKRRRMDGLPTHLLAQHYSRALTGRYTFKRPDWTFYTYFFHRFAGSHPWVLSAILAWTSANLYYAGQTKSLDDALRHYDDSLSLITEKYGTVQCEDKDGIETGLLSSSSSDDMDSLFVAYFFLALMDLVAVRSNRLRETLELVAALLSAPGFQSGITGVQARVISWFCILDGKASAFQAGKGAVLEAIGDEEGLVRAVRLSFTTLQKAYSITYPEEERYSDEKQHPLLELMLRLTSLLHRITQVRHNNLAVHDVNVIRKTLDSYRLVIESDLDPGQYEGRSRCTFLVLRALYHSVEISFSRCLIPGETRHAANQHAIGIIQISQKLKAMQPAGAVSSPPPTKFWPLPLVMAAIEVKDLIYREWAVNMLEVYRQVAGDNYFWSKKFVEAVCEREDRASARLDWGVILEELKDGLVI